MMSADVPVTTGMKLPTHSAAMEDYVFERGEMCPSAWSMSTYASPPIPATMLRNSMYLLTAEVRQGASPILHDERGAQPNDL